jgi:hypothetical protein
MAVTVTNLKNAQKDAIVKVSGTAATGTIDISALLADNQVLESGGTPKVTITGFHVNALSGATVTVTRNSVDILNIPGPNVDTVQFNQHGFVDNIEDDQDIEVTIAGAAANIYLFLRKTEGYKPTHEPAYYGAYDDPTQAGS